MKSVVKISLFSFLFLSLFLSTGCSDESGDQSVSDLPPSLIRRPKSNTGREGNTEVSSNEVSGPVRQLEKLDSSLYIQPLFSVENGHLSINEVSFVLGESNIEALVEILGPWELSFSNGA